MSTSHGSSSTRGEDLGHDGRDWTERAVGVERIDEACTPGGGRQGCAAVTVQPDPVAAMALSLLDPALPLGLARNPGRPDAANPGPPVTDEGHPEASKRWSLLRQLIAGDYHRPSPDHLGAYWNESRWRASHPSGPTAFRETVRALLRAEPLTYERLVGRSSGA